MSYSVRLFYKPLLRSCNGFGIDKYFHRWLAPTLIQLKKKKDEMGPEPPQRRSDFLEWNYKAEIFAFGKRLGEDFKEDFLREALTEKSYIESEEEKLKKVGVEPQLDLKDNSSMAVEGEKFISDYVLQYLQAVFPSLPKEFIRAIHDDLLSDEKLSHISKHIGIDDIVLCEEIPPEKEALSRSLKGVVQALLLSSGANRASEFVEDFVLTQLCGKDITPFCTPENPLEKLKSVVGSDIESRLIAEAGRNTILANYQVGIYKEKKLLGRGFGESPWIAEEMAALDALWQIWGITTNRKPFPLRVQVPLKQSVELQ